MKATLSLLLVGLVMIGGSCAGLKSTESAKAADHKMMIVAKLSIKPEKVTNFITAAREIIAKSNQESGCLSYQLYQDPYDPSGFVFVEEYKNQAAVDFHFATEHFKTFGPKIGDMVAAPAEIKIIGVASEEKK